MKMILIATTILTAALIGPAKAADLPVAYIGTYYQLEGTAAERCAKPDEWDDNFKITHTGMEWQDGKAKIVSISGIQDKLLVKLRILNGEEPNSPSIASTQVWRIARMHDGTVLLSRSEVPTPTGHSLWASIAAKCP